MTRLFLQDLPFDDLFSNSVAQSKADANVSEWIERFCGLVKEADLSWIIYKAAASDLDLLLRHTRSKSLPVPERLRDNSFAEYLWKNKCLETIEYLLFAKACEPHVTSPADTWQRTPRDTAAMKDRIAEGKKLFRNTRSDYLRLRLAYQLIRLAHYAGQYQLTLDLTEELLPQIDKQQARWKESIIPWWITGHKAGALQRLGQYAQASYLYALVFANCPSLQFPASQSFRIRNDGEWNECLKLCRSDRERAWLYALRASDRNAKALRDMQEIHRLDPGNEYLTALLLKEVKRMEQYFLGAGFIPDTMRGKHKITREVESYLVSLRNFVHQRNDEQPTGPQSLLWQAAYGYLSFLSGDFFEAQKTFEKCVQQAETPALKEQLSVFELALKVASLEIPDRNSEDFVAGLIRKTPLYRRYAALPDYVRYRMASLYQQAAYPGKAFLCNYPISALKANPNATLIDDLLAIAEKKDRSDFEHMLLKELSTDDLLDLKATLLMSRGELEAAFEAYRRMSLENWDNYGQFNPFRETFKDCIRCYRYSDTTALNLLNKGELLEELLDLGYKTRGNIGNIAQHHYRLGLAYYNMSYFGFQWDAMDYSRSGATWHYLDKGQDGVFCFYPYKDCIRENTDLSRALYHFDRARLSADPGSEEGAKAAFQAARCEQKIFFSSPDFVPPACCNNIPGVPDDRIPNYKYLKEQYSQTDFYRRIVRECKYFTAYARR